MLLYYVRHGDPIYNPDSLTPLGLRQAEAIGRRLASTGIDEIYASSSNRAILTSQPTCEMLKKEATILDWCNENHAWAQLTVIRKNGARTWAFHDPDSIPVLTSPEMTALGQEWYTHPMFAGTTFEEGYKRIQRETFSFLSSLGYTYDPEKGMYRCDAPNDKRIALFAHQGFGLAFLSCVLGIPYPYFCTHFDICHTGMSVIEFKNRNGYSIPQMLEHSNDSHLYREGLPLRYNNSVNV